MLHPEPTASFTLPLAGFGRRAAALLLDVVVLAGPLYFLAYTFSNFSETPATGIFSPQNSWLFHLLRVILVWLYFAAHESSVRQATWGKQLLGIIITNTTGGRLTFYQASVRHFARPFSILPLGLGYLVAAFRNSRQTFHDQLAATQARQKC